MVGGMRKIYPSGLNKGFSSKFCEGFQLWQEGSWGQQEAPEENLRAHQLKHCAYNNKYENNSLKNLNNTNYQASSQKFRKKRKDYGHQWLKRQFVDFYLMVGTRAEESQSEAIKGSLESESVKLYRFRLQLNLHFI